MQGQREDELPVLGGVQQNRIQLELLRGVHNAIPNEFDTSDPVESAREDVCEHPLPINVRLLEKLHLISRTALQVEMPHALAEPVVEFKSGFGIREIV